MPAFERFDFFKFYLDIPGRNFAEIGHCPPVGRIKFTLTSPCLAVIGSKYAKGSRSVGNEAKANSKDFLRIAQINHDILFSVAGSASKGDVFAVVRFDSVGRVQVGHVAGNHRGFEPDSLAGRRRFQGPALVVARLAAALRVTKIRQDERQKLACGQIAVVKPTVVCPLFQALLVHRSRENLVKGPVHLLVEAPNGRRSGRKTDIIFRSLANFDSRVVVFRIDNHAL